MPGTCNLKREESESNSLFSRDFTNQQIGAAYEVSNDLKVGLYREVNTNYEEGNFWAIAAEYLYGDKNSFLKNSVKARLTSQGVLSLFNKNKLYNNLTAETFLETGLNPEHRIQGIIGSNLFAGLKIVYNE